MTISGLRRVRSAIQPKTGSKMSLAAGQAATTRPRLPRLTPWWVVYSGSTGRSAPKPTHRMNSASRSGRIGPQRTSQAVLFGSVDEVIGTGSLRCGGTSYVAGLIHLAPFRPARPPRPARPCPARLSLAGVPQPRVPGRRDPRRPDRARAHPEAPDPRLADDLAANLLGGPRYLRADPGRGPLVGSPARAGRADRRGPAVCRRRPIEPLRPP